MNNISLQDHMAIADLLSEFSWRVDHGEADRVVELFVEDGTITTPMFTLTGRDEIARQFGERAKDKDRLSRHFWSNLRLQPLADGRVQAQTAVQTYIGTGPAPTAPENLVVGDSIDIVEKDEGGVWHFAERRLVVAFMGGK